MVIPERSVLSFHLTTSLLLHWFSPDKVNRRDVNASKLSPADSQLLSDPRLGIEVYILFIEKSLQYILIHQSILYLNLYEYLIVTWRDKIRIPSMSPVSRQGSPCYWLVLSPFVRLLAWARRQRSGGTNRQWLSLVPLCLVIAAPATGLHLCLVGWQ